MISDAFEPALLRTFVSVCNNGSLTLAATQAGRAQSALSAQIRRLEELLGQRLLRRTGRGVVPTAEGEIFLNYATRILALTEAATSRLVARPDTSPVRVGLGEDVATPLLQTALARLRRLHPLVQLNICIDHADVLGRKWREGAYDLVVGEIEAFSGDPIRTWTVDLHLFAGVDYDVTETSLIDVIVYAEDCSWRKLLLEKLASAGKEFRVAVSSSNMTAIAAAIESGLGVGLMPANILTRGKVRRVTIASDGEAFLKMTYGLFMAKNPTESVKLAASLLSESLNALTFPMTAPGSGTDEVLTALY